jgi:hypothetical protein
MFKKTTLTLIAFFILMQFVNAVQVVETQAPVEEKKGVFAGFFAFLKNPIFWYVVGALALVTLLGVGLFLLVRFLVKFIKKQNDIFYLMKQERISLAKVHRRYPSTHWWKVQKNTPIRLARKEDDGRLYISRAIANHRGDYVTHEGNMILSLNLEGRKKYWVFPDTDILVIPNKAKIIVKQRNERGDIVKEETFNLPMAKEIIQFNEGEILVFAESFSRVGEFLIPVLKSKDGKIVDLSAPIYQSLRDVIIGDMLYVQSSDFAGLSKRALEINPYIRTAQKLGDQNQSVDVPSQSTQEQRV